MAVPYTFGSATTSIPLSQLDSNFATGITLGNTTIQLGNTVTTLNNMTLANVTINSGTLNIQTNVANAVGILLEANGGTATTTGYYAFKNRMINGAMAIAQRGAVAAVNNTLTYGGCDRTGVAPVGFTTFSGTIQQQNAGFGLLGFSQAVTGCTSTGAGVVQFVQRIESKNCIDLNSNTITVTAKFYQNTGGALNCGFVISKAGSLDNFSSPTVISTGATTSVPSGVLTTISTTFTLGATDASNGLQCYGVFNGVGVIVSKDFHFTNFQLEKGSYATSFDLRPYGTELALCQRYYYKLQAAQQFDYFGMAWASATTAASAITPFPVTMRVAPSSLEQTGTAANYAVTYASSAATCSSVPTFQSASVFSARTTFPTSAVLTIGQGVAGASNSAAGYLAWSSEL